MVFIRAMSKHHQAFTAAAETGHGMLELTRHPRDPAAATRAIHVGVAWTGGGVLALRYRLLGEREQLRVPASAAPERVEGLWRHTCFEVFVMAGDEPAYREFNFSPAGAWQAYGFQAYRQGGPLAEAAAPHIVRVDEAGLGLDVLLPAQNLPSGPRLLVGLSAVIEAADGGLSYWALRHPPGQPDFHHPDCFALELIRP